MDGYLVIVSCGSQKIWNRYPEAGPIPAQNAYTSSSFKKCRLYSEHFAERWLILSARYGFVEPEFIIPSNYNVSFYDIEAVPTTTLREQVSVKNLTRFKMVGVLGSEAYWWRVVEAFEGSSVELRHVNGNVGFPPSFHLLINGLIENNTPFRQPDGT